MDMNFKAFFLFALIVALLICFVCVQSNNINVGSSGNERPAVMSNGTPTKLNHVTKRGLNLLNYNGFDTTDGYYTSPAVRHLLGSPWADGFVGNNFHQHHLPPTQMELTNAIAAAKQASANVLIAQQQVQAAKENVLNQQKVAAEKETHAAVATQKSEAAAAVQRSEAAAAAQAVILAQQRLASAKAVVAQQQKLAAVKEAHAASALQRSAHAASIEIERAEHDAAKLQSIQRSGTAAALHHVTATKDSIINPLTTGNNHVPHSAYTLAAGSGGALAHLSSSSIYNVPNLWTPSFTVNPALNSWTGPYGYHEPIPLNGHLVPPKAALNLWG